jgi:predicted acetyltransferase
MARFTLVEPSAAQQAEFLALAAEYASTGDLRYQVVLSDFVGYLQRLHDFARGENLPPGRVRESTYWGVDDGMIIGSIRLRHSLTPVLRQMGGNIGYDVRPSKRGQGYGTALLALILEQARGFGLSGLLITCDADNLASVRVIEKNSGRLISQGRVDGYSTLVARYWIDLMSFDKQNRQS